MNRILVFAEDLDHAKIVRDAALDPALRMALGSAGPNGYSMIVGFRPECPFCKHAAALESAAARLRWVGPYRGDEAESVLADRCAGPLPESSP